MPTFQKSDDRVDLAAVAAALSHEDGDGHHWDEADAREWLRRMGRPAQSDAEGDIANIPGDQATPAQVPSGVRGLLPGPQ